MKKLLALVTLSLFSVSCSAITLTVYNERVKNKDITDYKMEVTVEMTAENKDKNKPSHFTFKTNNKKKTINYGNTKVKKIKISAKCTLDSKTSNASKTISPLFLVVGTITTNEKVFIKKALLGKGIRIVDSSNIDGGSFQEIK